MPELVPGSVFGEVDTGDRHIQSPSEPAPANGQPAPLAVTKAQGKSFRVKVQPDERREIDVFVEANFHIEFPHSDSLLSLEEILDAEGELERLSQSPGSRNSVNGCALHHCAQVNEEG
jgi:hypothetical protein